MAYTDMFPPNDQVEWEERLAARIFDHCDVECSEQAANELGKWILQHLLRHFRPDLENGQRPIADRLAESLEELLLHIDGYEQEQNESKAAHKARQTLQDYLEGPQPE